jgi:hypothetical protein
VTATLVASDGTYSSSPVTSTININVASGQVLGNRLFYNNSKYDGHTTAGDAGINSFDDVAIASDKVGFNGVGTATFANISSAANGITGIIIDIKTGIGGNHSLINRTSGDITFKVAPTVVNTATYNQVSTWSSTLVPSPQNISVRLGAGVGGSDRIEITFAASVAVKNNWLEIKLKGPGGNSGLAADDVFYFGSNVGNSGLGDGSATQSKTEATDGVVAANNILSVTTQVFQIADYDKDGAVASGDGVTSAKNNGILLRYIVNPTGPFAPDGGAPSGTPAAVAAALPTTALLGSLGSTSSTTSALVSSLGGLGASAPSNAPVKLPAPLANRLETLLHSPVARSAQTLLSDPRAHAALDQLLTHLSPHDEALDDLLNDLGLG